MDTLCMVFFLQIKSNQVYLYTAYFHKIQGCLQYKTMYVKLKKLDAK